MNIQDVQDMPVAGFSGFAQTPLEDQIKKYSDDMPMNDVQAAHYGSRLNHKTGEVQDRSTKAASVTAMQCGTPSAEYLNGYDATVWDHDKEA